MKDPEFAPQRREERKEEKKEKRKEKKKEKEKAFSSLRSSRLRGANLNLSHQVLRYYKNLP